jgi:hypothetical protein
MKKLTFEEKQERAKKKKWDAIAKKPILAMANYDSFAIFRLQVIGKTKHSVTMRMINGKGTITLSTKNGQPIEEIIKIESLPCDITPSVTYEGKTKQIPQGSDVPM